MAPIQSKYQHRPLRAIAPTWYTEINGQLFSPHVMPRPVFLLSYHTSCWSTTLASFNAFSIVEGHLITYKPRFDHSLVGAASLIKLQLEVTQAFTRLRNKQNSTTILVRRVPQDEVQAFTHWSEGELQPDAFVALLSLHFLIRGKRGR